MENFAYALSQFVVLKPLSYCIKETVGFENWKIGLVCKASSFISHQTRWHDKRISIKFYSVPFMDRRLQTEVNDSKQDCLLLSVIVWQLCWILLLFNKCAAFIEIKRVWPVCSYTLVECIDILGQNIFNLINFYRCWRNIMNLAAHELGTAMSRVSKLILPKEKLFVRRCI